MNPACMFTEQEVLDILSKVHDSSLHGENPKNSDPAIQHGMSMHTLGWTHAITRARLALVKAARAKERAVLASIGYEHLAGCDTAKQAPAPAGVNSPEFFVCADPTCGKVCDIDDGHGNEYIPGPYCLECWNAICAASPILTESYDC